MRRTTGRVSRRRGGFTLIELLIVVAIIGILAAIAIPNFNQARTRALISRSKAELRDTTQANTLYKMDWGQYVPDGNDQIPVPSGRSIPSRYTAGRNLQTYVNENVWKKLTTPVAYLSSIIYDPFGKITAGDRKSTNMANGICFCYDTIVDAANGVDPGTYYVRSRTEYIAYWSLGAMGPDLIVGDSHRSFGGPLGYDPSNGLRSKGDIIRIPPPDVAYNGRVFGDIIARYIQQAGHD